MKAIKMLVNRIIAAEAPIHFDALSQRVVLCYRLTRPGTRSAQVVGQVVSEAASEGRCKLVGEFVWGANVDPNRDFIVPRGPTIKGEMRAPEHIPPEEWAAAAGLVIQQAIGLPREELLKQTAILLGFCRFTPKLRSWADAGVTILLKRGLAAERNGNVTVSS